MFRLEVGKKLIRNFNKKFNQKLNERITKVSHPLARALAYQETM